MGDVFVDIVVLILIAALVLLTGYYAYREFYNYRRIKRMCDKGIKTTALVKGVRKLCYKYPVRGLLGLVSNWDVHIEMLKLNYKKGKGRGQFGDLEFCFPIVQFTVNGETITKTLGIESPVYEDSVGKKMEIRYNPHNLQECCAEAEIDDAVQDMKKYITGIGLYTFLMLLLAFGGGFLAIMIAGG